jgi:D-sedoheptulose 7-phosphate isomerase
MIGMHAPAGDGRPVAALFERRVLPVQDLAEHAEDVARACYAMAFRFHLGGQLVAFGNGGSCTDARHVAVEFVHPVIVGKRALPALSRGLECARELGTLTVALVGGDGGAIGNSRAVDHVPIARSADTQVVKETHVTTYHVLWELVHAFFEHPGVLSRESARP